MKVTIDHDRCTGHGRCYSLAPELFEPDDDGYGQVLGDGTVPGGDEVVAQRGRDGCPERAVLIT